MSQSASLIQMISEIFTLQENETKKEIGTNQFKKGSLELIWDYSPDIKVKSYNLSYSYPYLSPGTTSTPVIYFETSQYKIQLSIEVELIKDTTPHVHPDSVKTKI